MKRKNRAKWTYHGQDDRGLRYWTRYLEGGQYILGLGALGLDDFRWSLTRAPGMPVGNGIIDSVMSPADAQREALVQAQEVIEARKYADELRASGFSKEEALEILGERWPKFRVKPRDEVEPSKPLPPLPPGIHVVSQEDVAMLPPGIHIFGGPEDLPPELANLISSLIGKGDG